MNRATGDHNVSTFHDDSVALFGSRFDAGRKASIYAHAFGLRFHQQSRSVCLGVGEPGFRGGLFCAYGTTVPAVPANTALVAANYVARHRIHVPAKSTQSAFHHLFAA
jgi:hypothetical protein